MEFKWLNEGQIKTEDNRIEMFAPAQSDFFFNNGAVSEEGNTPESLCNAPFYHTEIAGDFVMRVKVSHDFKDTYRFPWLTGWRQRARSRLRNGGRLTQS